MTIPQVFYIQVIGDLVTKCSYFLAKPLHLQAPARFHHDMVPIVCVLVVWLLGGYINTSANILAPSLVPGSLVGRASALMALTFQVKGHFLSDMGNLYSVSNSCWEE